MFFCITWDVNNVKKVLTVDLELSRENQLPLDVTLQKIVPYISIHGLSQKQLKFFFSVNQDSFLFTTKCTADVEPILTFHNGYNAILRHKILVDKQNSKMKLSSKSFFEV